MCAGIATLFGPPTVGGLCYLTWQRGRDATANVVGRATAGFGANVSSAVSLVGAYLLQRSVIVRPLFDEGGALALDWKKGTESLGEPLKIKTWTQFYRAAGPPVFARTMALVLAFYVSGSVHAWTAAKLDPPPPPPPKPKPKAGARPKKQ